MEYSPGQLHTSLIFTLLFYFSPPLFFLSRFCSYGEEFADHVRSHLAQFHLSSLLSQILSQIPKMADEHEDEVFTFLTNQQREYNANLDNLPKWTNRTEAMKAALGEIEGEEKAKIAMATVYNPEGGQQLGARLKDQKGRDDKVKVFFKELIDQVEITDDAFNKHMEKCNADEKRVKSQYDEACFDISEDVKAFEKRIDRWRLMLKERYRGPDKALIEAKVDYLENANDSDNNHEKSLSSVGK